MGGESGGSLVRFSGTKICYVGVGMGVIVF